MDFASTIFNVMACWICFGFGFVLYIIRKDLLKSINILIIKIVKTCFGVILTKLLTNNCCHKDSVKILSVSML